jgi:hypothetical protein
MVDMNQAAISAKEMFEKEFTPEEIAKIKEFSKSELSNCGYKRLGWIFTGNVEKQIAKAEAKKEAEE